MRVLTSKQQEILEYIEEFTDQKGMSPTVYEIAEKFGIRASTVFAHLKALQRKERISRTSKARSIALRSGKAPLHMSLMVPIPLLGRINAGLPADTPELKDDEVMVSAEILENYDIEKVFALRVLGESMRDLDILEGDIVIVYQTKVAETGDVVVALVNNETTVKSFYPAENSTIELRPANPEFQTQIYNINEVTLQGKVIAVQH